MSIPKEPRQLMINIMYLVLTAMLALNVSAEIINAFKKLNNSMEISNDNMQLKINDTYAAFEAKIAKNKGRGKEHLTKAQAASEYADEVYDQLETIKKELIEFSGGYIMNEDSTYKLDKDGLREMKGISSTSATTNYFVKGTETLEPQGPVLKELLSGTRDKFLSFFNDNKEDRTQLEQLLPLKIEMDSTMVDENMEFDPWSKKNFYMLPTVAAITELTRYQNEVRIAEQNVVEKFSDRVGEKRINFDSFEAAVIPNGSKFITGDPLSLEMFLSASSSSSKPEIYVNGQRQNVGANGRAEYETKTSGTGKKTLDVEVRSKNQFGEMKSYKKKFEYEVVPPFRQEYKAIVSPVKMNVFYIGVDNPVEVGISGIAADKVQAQISGGGGQMKKVGDGRFMVRVSGPPGSKAKVDIRGEKPEYDREGGSFNGSKEFRVKKIPDPIAEIGGKTGGKMRTGEFKAQSGISAVLNNFDFDAKFVVTRFDVTFAPRRNDLQIKSNNGPYFSGAVQGLMAQAKPGDAFFFDDIHAKGPDGVERNIGGIALKIN